jgi:hypothetical protein
MELFMRAGDWERAAKELAVLDTLTDDLPRGMRPEIERYRLALDMRRQQALGGGTA